MIILCDLTSEEKAFLLDLLLYSKMGWDRSIKTGPKSIRNDLKKAVSMCEEISFKLKEGAENA